MTQPYKDEANPERALGFLLNLGKKAPENFFQIEANVQGAEEVFTQFGVEGSQMVDSRRIRHALGQLEQVKKDAEEMQRQLSVILVLDLGMSMSAVARMMGRTHPYVKRWVEAEEQRRALTENGEGGTPSLLDGQ